MLDFTAPHVTGDISKVFEPLVDAAGKLVDAADKLVNSKATFFVLTIISAYVGYTIFVGLHRGG